MAATSCTQHSSMRLIRSRLRWTMKETLTSQEVVVDADYTGTPGAWRTKCRNPNTAAPLQFCNWIVKLNTGGSTLAYSTLIDDVRVCFAVLIKALRLIPKVKRTSRVPLLRFSAPATGSPPPCHTTANAFRTTVSGNGTGTVVMKFTADGKALLFSTWVSGPTPQDQFYARLP